MASRGPGNFIAVLTLAVYVVTSMLAGPGSIVLCRGADGHVAIEPVHGPLDCHDDSDAGEAAFHHAGEVASPSCHDVLLVFGLPQVKTRVSPVTAGSLRGPAPPALVSVWCFAEATSSPTALLAALPPPPSAPAFLRTVVLLT